MDDFVTLNDVRLKARGRGQRLRGLKHKQRRPDLIILDDIENDQQARSPDLVKGGPSWVTGAVYRGHEATARSLDRHHRGPQRAPSYTAIHPRRSPAATGPGAFTGP